MEYLNKITGILLVIMSMFLFQGCDLIFGIFEAGLWVGIILSIIFLVIIIFIAVKLFKWLTRRR